MGAKDFRLGNIIKGVSTDYCIIDEIETSKVTGTFRNSQGVFISTYHTFEIPGMPLTEEWLLKFGFEHKSGNEYVKGRFTYRKQQRDIVINGFEYDYNGILISVQDMQVHEFQNLFYTIEREELEIKETVTP